MARLKASVLVPNLSNAGFLRGYLIGEALLGLGYEVELFGFELGERLYCQVPAKFPIYVLPSQYPDFIKSIGFILKRLDGDLIYAIKPQPASFGIALLKRLLSRCPVILDIDNLEMSEYGGDRWIYQPNIQQLKGDLLSKNGALKRLDHPLFIKGIERFVKQADAITVTTNFLKQRYGGTLVPNSKDIHLFDPNQYNPEESRHRHGLSEYRVLLFPGTPQPQRGLEDILAALEQLNEPDLRLVTVGKSFNDDYEKQLLNRWGKWIINLPIYSVELMPDAIACAHLIVVPQLDTEVTIAQFPMKLISGMAMAKPILSTKVGDIPTILGDTGYLVDPSSPQQLAEKISWIFQHLEEANNLGKLARERCIENYSIEAVSKIIFPLLQAIQSMKKR